MFPKIVGFPPKSSILIGFSIITHPFWGATIFGNTHTYIYTHELCDQKLALVDFLIGFYLGDEMLLPMLY